MAFRPDTSAFNSIALSTGERIVGLSTDSEPAVGADGGELEVGQTWFWEDTGALKYWTGSAWKAVNVEQVEALKLSLLFEIRDLLRGEE